MAKPKQPAPAAADGQSLGDRYQVVGFEATETMPIRFEGREFDLACLSDDELAYLLQFPDQVPYFKEINQIDQE